jgi:hypothetical protein
MALTRVLLISLLLLEARFLGAASDSRSAALFVTFRPEVALSGQSLNTVGLKIRLSDGGSAHLWLADICSSVPSAAYIVRASGEYQIPVPSLGTAGTMVCLSSTDGLRSQLQLPTPVRTPVQ